MSGSVDLICVLESTVDLSVVVVVVIKKKVSSSFLCAENRKYCELSARAEMNKQLQQEPCEWVSSDHSSHPSTHAINVKQAG